MGTILEERIARMIEPTLTDMGYGLVRVQLQGKLLQIMIERLDHGFVNVDDCTRASRSASALLDVEDTFKEPYHLEVTSAGLDRPLMNMSDFERFKGSAIQMETKILIEGQKRFRGSLEDVVDDVIHLRIDGHVFSFPFSDVAKAKLVVTDAMIKKSLKNGNLKKGSKND